MSFYHSYRARLPVRSRGPIFAVGRRVYVASPGSPARLTSTDDGAGDALTGLVDGAEVEILAWRPRSSGTLYRVRSTRAGVEGWLAAGSVCSAEPTLAPSERPSVAPLRPKQRPAVTASADPALRKTIPRRTRRTR
jgi:hypothetical protein